PVRRPRAAVWWDAAVLAGRDLASRVPSRRHSPHQSCGGPVMHAHLRPSLLVLTGLGVLLLSGCAKATVSATRPTAGNVARPDRVIVHDFAVTPRDVGLDRGLGPRAAREVSAGPESEETVRVGQADARALSDKLVQNLD